MNRMIELIFYYGSLIAVLAVAGYFGASRGARYPAEEHTEIVKIAERPGFVKAIASTHDGTIYLTFRDEHGVFRLDGRTGQLEVIRTLESPTFMAADRSGAVHLAYSVDPGFGDVFHWAIARVTRSDVVEELRVASSIGGLAVDEHGSVYVVANQAGEIWKVDRAGQKTLLVGPTLANGVDQVLQPEGIAVNRKGQLLFTDSRHSVFLMDNGRLRHLAGRNGECGMVDGSGDSARFCGPAAASVDREGNFLVIDQDCAVRKVTPTGQVTTVVGLNDGGPRGVVQLPAEQCLTAVRSVAVDGNGDILLAARSALRVRTTPSK